MGTQDRIDDLDPGIQIRQQVLDILFQVLALAPLRWSAEMPAFQMG